MRYVLSIYHVYRRGRVLHLVSAVVGTRDECVRLASQVTEDDTDTAVMICRRHS